MNILTGRFKGRSIPFREEPGLRPTHNKIRKAVVDAFAGWLGGIRVLDLYSGTGALGMELLSAGAASATFVERDPARARLIAQWLDAVGLKRDCTVLAEDAFRAVARFEKAGERFDLAILDPPYEDPEAPRILPKIAGLLEREAFVVYECRSTSDAPAVQGLEKIRDRIYGDTRLAVYRKDAS
jgi:16S rRNA (guanine966-N2)-methyltransferase